MGMELLADKRGSKAMTPESRDLLFGAGQFEREVVDNWIYCPHCGKNVTSFPDGVGPAARIADMSDGSPIRIRPISM